jgi:type II secretory pathway component GspD/PulD (secretin)
MVMRLLSPIASVAVALCVVSSAASQDRRSPADRRSDFQQSARSGVIQQKAAGRLVSVEVVIADLSSDGDETEMTAEKLAELDKAGKVTSLSRVRLSALENQQAVVQFGEQVPIVTGRTFSGASQGTARELTRNFDPAQMLRSLDVNKNNMLEPNELSNRSSFFIRSAAERAGLDMNEPLPIDKLTTALQQARGDARGASQEVVTLKSVGTLVSVTARVDQDESILMELNVEQSRPPAAANTEGDGAARSEPQTATITSQTTLRVPQGKTVVAGSKQTKTVQTWILVSAQADAKRPAEEDNAALLKIFTLVHAQPQNVAELIRTIFRGEEVRVGIDDRTNSLVVHGDAEKLDVVYRLIIRLDEAGAAAPQP